MDAGKILFAIEGLFDGNTNQTHLRVYYLSVSWTDGYKIVVSLLSVIFLIFKKDLNPGGLALTSGFYG